MIAFEAMEKFWYNSMDGSWDAHLACDNKFETMEGKCSFLTPQKPKVRRQSVL